MDPKATQPSVAPASVLYQCACGEQIVLDPEAGGVCPKCERIVSPKLLKLDLGMTVSLENGSLPFEQTLPGGTFDLANPDNPVVVRDSEAEDPDILIGKMFGHFKIISPLGRGGMGQVYRALDTSLQRFVAVKLLRSGIGTATTTSKSSDREIDKLLQEAISQGRVTHPNIVTIYYVGKQDGNPFLAMELVNGEPLSQRIADGLIPFDETVMIALDIAHALEYSFQGDIIHGDIKPSNVLIAQNGMAKLSDFGMARSASDDTNKTMGGTPNYIAPELLEGDKPSLQSDIYALGVTLYEMSFGKLPLVLTGQTIPQWIRVHKASKLVFPHPWPARLPEQWKVVLEKMLAKQPEMRFQSYHELIAAVERLRPGSKVLARTMPRLIAAGIDWLSVLSLAIIFQIALGMPLRERPQMLEPAMRMLFHACDVIPIVAYTILIYFWRQSIGRSLMHIRVVNQYGMQPTGNQIAIRSAIRMQLPWILICLRLYGPPSSSWLQIGLAVLVVLSISFLLLELGFMLIGHGRSIHDLIAKTRVVLDTSG